MSEHDLRDDYDDEPWRRLADAEAKVKRPAACISVFAMIQLGLSIWGFVWIPGVLVYSWIDPAYFDDEIVWYEMLLLELLSAITIVMTLIILVAAKRLRTFRSFRLVLTGLILFTLSTPFYCGPVTIPLAIWGIVVLFNRDVRARFEAVARGTIPSPAQEPNDARIDRTP